MRNLKRMSQENLYVDLGMGLSMDSFDNVVSSTAFNMSLPGINAVGYGTDENGLSNNLITLAGKLADALESDTFNADEYGKLMNKFDSLGTNLMNQITELGVKSEFLIPQKIVLEMLKYQYRNRCQALKALIWRRPLLIICGINMHITHH